MLDRQPLPVRPPRLIDSLSLPYLAELARDEVAGFRRRPVESRPTQAAPPPGPGDAQAGSAAPILHPALRWRHPLSPRGRRHRLLPVAILAVCLGVLAIFLSMPRPLEEPGAEVTVLWEGAGEDETEAAATPEGQDPADQAMPDPTVPEPPPIQGFIGLEREGPERFEEGPIAEDVAARAEAVQEATAPQDEPMPEEPVAEEPVAEEPAAEEPATAEAVETDPPPAVGPELEEPEMAGGEPAPPGETGALSQAALEGVAAIPLPRPRPAPLVADIVLPRPEGLLPTRPGPRPAMPVPASPGEPPAPPEGVEQNVLQIFASDGPEPRQIRGGFSLPAYPLRARLLSLEGNVILRVEISAQGGPGHVWLEQSSGYPELDEAAYSAVRKWRFQPPTYRGVPVNAEIQIPVVFRLKRPAPG